MDPDGSNQTILTDTQLQDETDPAWSPDGTMLSFTVVDIFTGHYNIWTMAADGTAAANVTTDAGQRFAYSSWSPNGNRLAFTKQDPNDGRIWRVHTIDIDGTDLLIAGADIPSFLAADVPWFLGPIWSAEGDSIVAVENELQIIRFPADGSSGYERIYGDGTELMRWVDWAP